MLKKIFIATFMFALIFSQNVSAEEVFVHSDDDYSYYVLTESIVNRTEYDANPTFDVTVQIRYRDSFKRELNYSLWENDGIIWYTTGNGTGMHAVYADDPLMSVWKYCLKFFRIDDEVSYK